ncbi:redox-sensitive transcriptional activator SoxR [Deinococcus marmoris]|uniref:Redox-sensitive transcriptional activator SoxR n=1 Tax=Deinococcus marmoris TaxID=249408 RepID=A0A1U7P3C5_9DEIO|nr:redox-sensitive transcriptional activator SoxR [Deinococcus marmoris]OLV19659.1 Redox-sensitive transcriptional activator SoxR [Deinococcus marmoris]
MRSSPWRCPLSPPAPDWTPAQLAERSGLNISTLHFYEREGLIVSTPTTGNQRCHPRDTVRRLAFVRASAQVGVPLAEIRAALADLPAGRTPTAADWERLSENWRGELDDRMATLTRLRNDLGAASVAVASRWSVARCSIRVTGMGSGIRGAIPWWGCGRVELGGSGHSVLRVEGA